MTSSEKTKDLGASHNYRYINANNVYNAGSNSAHQTGTYTAGTKASAAASTYDMGNTNKYRYINATAAWNKASSTGYVSGTAAKLSNVSLTSCANPSFTHSTNWSTTFNGSTHSIIFWRNDASDTYYALYVKHNNTLTKIASNWNHIKSISASGTAVTCSMSAGAAIYVWPLK